MKMKLNPNKVKSAFVTGGRKYKNYCNYYIGTTKEKGILKFTERLKFQYIILSLLIGIITAPIIVIAILGYLISELIQEKLNFDGEGFLRDIIFAPFTLFKVGNDSHLYTKEITDEPQEGKKQPYLVFMSQGELDEFKERLQKHYKD